MGGNYVDNSEKNIKKQLKENKIINFYMDKYRYYTSKYIENDKQFCVCLIDVERFRYYNYIHGYQYGDIIFNEFFNYIYKKIGKKGEIYRFNNDRIIIMLEIEETKNILANIEEILNLSNVYIDVNGLEREINFKAGISMYPKDSKCIDDLLKYSEIALNYAKKFTKRKYEFFKESMYKDILKNDQYIIELENALKENEFIVYYQPQVNSKTMKLYGMEALLRWNNPKLGVISPLHFIELLESNRMINDVGKFVFKEACRLLKNYEKLGYSELCVSINMSEIQFEDETLLNFIEDTIEETQVNPKCINIEITERFLVRSTKNVLNILDELRAKGMKVFIDDFGIKYSSLNYLFKLPIDGIKIDKSFIDRIHYSDKEFIIVKNIINLAREIGLDVVVEGVEKEEQLEYLSKINCHNIQGFIFGKPVASKYFFDYLELLY